MLGLMARVIEHGTRSILRAFEKRLWWLPNRSWVYGRRSTGLARAPAAAQWSAHLPRIFTFIYARRTSNGREELCPALLETQRINGKADRYRNFARAANFTRFLTAIHT
jgi:hypothetical protein